MVYYILHMQIFWIVSGVMKRIGCSQITSYVEVIVTLLVCPVIIYIFKQLRLQWLLGK